ncbi:putative anti-sigma factor [Parabacteroides sp. CAG:409]|nr:putative anti-sigma factor [Parabacteroides sp. CAG:409]
MKEKQQHITDRNESGLSNLTDEELWVSSVVADDTQQYDVDQAFERFRKRTGLDQSGRQSYKWYRTWSVAAVAIVLLGLITVTAYWQGSRQIQSNFSDIVVEAPLGSKTKLTLPDGSTVWLNAGSKMVYSQGFGVSDRRLAFQGEGYFEVEKNDEMPFLVQTHDVNVTVVGTKFNFRNYPEDEEAVVELLEGKVALENQLKEEAVRYLSPNEKMVLHKATGEMDITSAKVKEVTLWTENILLFDEDLLPDIVRELERSYHVQIEIENEDLKQTRFYGQFNQLEQNIYDVLDMLSETGKLKYHEEGKVIYLK